MTLTEAATCGARGGSPCTVYAAQALPICQTTVTNRLSQSIPTRNMLGSIRVISRTFGRAAKRVGDGYTGSLRGATSSLFSCPQASTLTGPCNSLRLERGPKRGCAGSSRPLLSWALPTGGLPEGQSQKGMIGNASRRDLREAAIEGDNAGEELGASDRDVVQNAVLQKGDESDEACSTPAEAVQQNRGACESEAGMSDETVCLEGDLGRGESSGGLPEVSAELSSREESSCTEAREPVSSGAQELVECTSDAHSQLAPAAGKTGETARSVKSRLLAKGKGLLLGGVVRKNRAGRGSLASTKAGADSPSPPRVRQAKASSSADIGKEDVISEAATSRVFKETGRRPLKEALKPLPVTDLLTIKGIGPTYVGRFMEQGYRSVKDLEDLYREKFYRKSEGMVAFLQRDIGVKQQVWARSIVEHIEKPFLERETGDAESKEGQGSQAASEKPLTFCVEGNISVGKSTFLRQIVSKTFWLNELVDISPEPVEKWQSVGEHGHNILQSFYQNPARYAYTFQNYVFFTRMMQAQELSLDPKKKLRLMERSVFSDRMVFVRAVHEAKYMSDMEISIYDSWFNPMLSAIPTLVPDGFIYLRANPDTCFNRLQKRGRLEENTVKLDYLQNLHEKHEQWLIPSAAKSSSSHTLVRDFQQGHKEEYPELIRNNVFSLRDNDVLDCIKGVPALVLDCDPDMHGMNYKDVEIDYAKKINSFYDYIRKNQLEGGADRHIKQPHGGILQPGVHPDGLIEKYRSMALDFTSPRALRM